MRDTRRCMDPSSLESLLVLKFNPDLWTIKIVNSVIKREDAPSISGGGGGAGGNNALVSSSSAASVSTSVSSPSGSVVSSVSASSF